MKLLTKLRALFSREKLDTEMSEEMRTHLELQVAQNISRGMNADEARYVAQRPFGGQEKIKESARDARGLRWVHDFGRDFHFALRVIAKAPVLSTVIVLSLAVGLGANTAVFSWIRTVALEPLPGVSDGRHLLVIEQRSGSGIFAFASAAEWHDLRRLTQESLTGIAAQSIGTFSLESGSEVVHLSGEYVTENFFSLLGVAPALGHWPAPADDQPGSAPVAVISHRLWQTQFGASRDIIGRVVRLTQRNVTIVAVAPPKFLGGVTALRFDVWLPQAPWLKQDDRSARIFQLLARGRASTSPAQAQADVARALRQLAETYPESNRGETAEVIPLVRSGIGAQAVLVPTLATLQTVAILLLLIVCTNTANLLLAQASVRTKEIAIRLSLGAGRARVVRQLVTEGFVLALLGMILGTGFAFWGLELINQIPKPETVAIAAHLDFGEFGLSLGLAAICAVGFALVPALQATRPTVGGALKIGGRTSGGGGRRKLQEALVGAEIALTLVVVIVAGLFVRSFDHARLVHPGFDSRQVALGVVDLAANGYDPVHARAFAEALLTRVREQPGMQSAALARGVPLYLNPMRPVEFALEGREVSPDAFDLTFSQEISRGYLETLRIELTEGRDFTSVAEKPGDAEAIINEEFRRRYLAEGQPAVGRRLTVRGHTYRIVGVTRTGKYGTVNESPQPMVYFPLGGQWPYWTLFVRTSSDPVTAFPALRRVVREVDGGLRLFEQRTLAQHVEDAIILRVIPAKILGGLGPLTLFLAVTGLYSVLAYAVAQRTHEIGVRMTLGATARSVILLFLRQGLVAVIGGLAIGWGGAYVASVRLSRELVEVPAGDPALFICLPVLLGVVAVLACWLPARRATKVDPMVALRCE